jgi:hypothetical protein
MNVQRSDVVLVDFPFTRGSGSKVRLILLRSKASSPVYASIR